MAVYLTELGIAGSHSFVLKDAEQEKRYNSLQVELKIENELEEILHSPVNVRVINTAPVSFQYNVIKDGIVILEKNKNLRSDFEGLVFKNILNILI